MAKNYGINIFKKALAQLAEKESKLFQETGEGFKHGSDDCIQEAKYLRLLSTAQKERKILAEPSYDPDVHGTIDNIK